MNKKNDIFTKSDETKPKELNVVTYSEEADEFLIEEEEEEGEESIDETEISNEDLFFGTVFGAFVVYCLIPFGGEPSIIYAYILELVADFNSLSADAKVLAAAILIANSFFILGIGIMVLLYGVMAFITYPFIAIKRVINFLKKMINK